MKSILNLISAFGCLDDQQQTEANKLVQASLESADLKEGQAAFLEKRKPHFNNI